MPLAIGDAVWIASAAVVQAVAIAVVGLVMRRMDINAKERADAQAAEVKEVKAAVVETKDVIVTLEKNTNSMKDALVLVVGQSEKAKGVLQGREEMTVEMNEGTKT